MYSRKNIACKIFTVLCLILLMSMPYLSYAAEVGTEQTPAPEPTETIPPSYTEPIQTNEVTGWPEGPAVYAESAVLIDADTGTILYSKNADAQKYPASITKIMTALLAIENSAMDERVLFSDNAIWGIERDSSHIGIRIGENLSMEDCLYGIMLESANEVCLAVAEHISGTTDNFVDLMNKRAAKLGCKNTHFTNPNGLPDEQHYTSAADMALIAAEAFRNETFRKICGTKAYQIGWTNKTGEDRWLGNHHKMLWDSSEYYYEGCLGGKTGYTDVALNTLVTYASRNDMNLICVTMRTAGRRVYTDTAALMDYGFTNFRRICISDDKPRDYSFYLFPSPAAFANCSYYQTRQDILKKTFATVPVNAKPDDLTLRTKAGPDVIKRIFTYNKYRVAVDRITQPTGLRTLFGAQISSNKGTAVSDPDTGLTASFTDLPAWKYPVIILFGLAVTLLILQIILFLQKQKRKKRKN